MVDKNGLFEEADFENVRHELVKKHKELVDSNAHIVQWGKVVEAMINDESIDKDDWIKNCTKYLEGEDLKSALIKLI